MDKIEKYLDFILLNIDNNKHIGINKILLKHKDLKEPILENDKTEFNTISEKVKDLGCNKYGYFRPINKDLLWFEITETGLFAIESGGHFKYQKSLDLEKSASIDRQLKSDKIQSNELKLSNWKICTFWFGFIFSFIALIVSIKECSNGQDNKDQIKSLKEKMDTISLEVSSHRSLLDSLRNTKTNHEKTDSTTSHKQLRKGSK